MITIKEINTGKKHDADKPLLPLWQQLCTNTGEASSYHDNDERNPNRIHLTRQDGGWTLNAGSDEHVFEPCDLKPDRFQVIDTDYIAKVDLSEYIDREWEMSNSMNVESEINKARYDERIFLLEQLISQIE